MEAGTGGVELALVLRTLAALELMVDLREVELDQLSATPGALDPADTPVPLGEA